MTAQEEKSFLDWLTSNGTFLCPDMALHSFEADGMGRGLIATKDIQKDTLLFSLPRNLILTTSTSNLHTLIRDEDWNQLQGWCPLILSMMYERRRGTLDTFKDLNWKPYFDLLPPPNSFNSLMYWNQAELEELEGTTIVNKIGKDEAEESWREQVWPLVLKYSDEDKEMEKWYGLDSFHYCGSLVLSRSFHVDSKPEGEGKNQDDEGDSDGEDDEEEEEREDVADVAMVPMADILNAKSQCDNARLFYEPLTLNMHSTSFIPAGSQIWNTYADPPNSDLLRRYGHVDDVNLNDEVELGLEDVVEYFVGQGKERDDTEERAEWLCEMGLDDTFSFPLQSPTPECPLPMELLSAIRTFLLSPEDFEKYQKKEEPPKPKLEKQVLEAAKAIVLERRKGYKTSIEEDESLLSNTGTTLPLRQRQAIVVRLSEKRILSTALRWIEGEIEGGKEKAKSGEGKKRKAESGKERDGKKGKKSAAE
ncbi:SET domain-containing protein [Meredithblackwellia eburnea MCA 4105]